MEDGSMEPRAQVLKSSFELAHMVFNAVVGDLSDEMARHRLPGGMVPTAGAMIAHMLYGEDMMVGQVSGEPMLIDSNGWGAKTGIVRVSPAMTPDWLTQDFNLAGLKEYAQAVFARTEAFLERASAADLDKKMPTPIGGEVSGAEYLGGFAVVHIAEHTGEVSTLKGAQGAKGLPF
jgi:hypothetical protein